MEQIKQKIAAAVGELYGVELEPEVTVAAEGVRADVASNVAMRLAKQVGKAPRAIAEEIARKLELGDWKVEVAGPGFLNFIASDEYFIEKVAGIAGDFDKNIS